MTLFVTILQLLCGLIVIGIVLFQSGKSAGLSGAIGGVADSFMAKNKAKSTDARLDCSPSWSVPVSHFRCRPGCRYPRRPSYPP